MHQPANGSFAYQLLNRQEIAVPAPVMKRASSTLAPWPALSTGRSAAGWRHRLVHDHVLSGLQNLPRNLEVCPVRRGDNQQFDRGSASIPPATGKS